MSARRPAVAVEGDFFANGPIAIANRGLFGALARRGDVDLAIFAEPRAGTIPGPSGTVLDPLRDRRFGANGPEVTIRHAWPPATSYVRRGASIHVQPWEYGALPVAWGQAWPGAVDEIWCYGSHLARTYAASGFSAERVQVVPLGVDPAVYRPDGPRGGAEPRRRCRFLFSGQTVRRKGIDVAIESYLRAFGPNDDVELVIKDFEPPGVAAMETARASILSLCGRSDLARIVYLEEEFADEAAMAALYRSATCLVHPYRAEAFGLTVLEAAACGVPAIVTRGGATDDFVDPEGSYPVDALRVDIGSAGLCGEGWILQPNATQVVEAMRVVYADPAGARARGARAAASAARWTWDRSAACAAERIAALAESERTAPSRRPRPSHDGFPAINIFEDKVCSQNGEDGILAELFRRLGVRQPFFAEIGVEEGRECNTARLARDYGWRGAMFEGDPVWFAALARRYRERSGVKAVEAFVSRENAIDVLAGAGVPDEFDLLSIDIDGNDYWVWERLGERFRPRVTVVEINPAHPPPELWVIAYDPNFRWRRTDYYGASLQSMTELGKRLGYALVGMESRAVNAFFVRRDLLDALGLPELDPRDAFRPPTYSYPPQEGPALRI